MTMQALAAALVMDRATRDHNLPPLQEQGLVTMAGGRGPQQPGGDADQGRGNRFRYRRSMT